MVIVRDGLPVVLINGTPSTDPVKTETFFAQAALSGSGTETPWIRATVQTEAETDVSKLAEASVIVLANLATVSDELAQAIDQLVKTAGRSVLITCGDQMQPESYNSWFADGRGWMPCQLNAIAEDTVAELRGVHVSNEGLELPWLLPFRAEQGGTLTEARFAKWQTVTWDLPPENGVEKPRRPVIAARLNTGDPWLLIKKHGRGSVAVLTSTLDADWNTLPAKADFVPWLHELLFFLSNSEASRNVETGQPLVLNVPREFVVEDFVFRAPNGQTLPAERGGDDVQRLARLSDPEQPGVYRLESLPEKAAPGTKPEYFAVQTDRGESDLTPLGDGQRALLTAGKRLVFVNDLAELQTRLTADTSRAEVWWVVLYLFLAVLVWETWMTRRLVRGGQMVTDDEGEPQRAAISRRESPKTRRRRTKV